MELINNFLIRVADKCRGKSELYQQYRNLIIEDVKDKELKPIIRYGTKLDHTLSPLRYALLPKETVRYMVVGKKVEKYAGKLYMKYRAARESAKRKIEKEAKNNPEINKEEKLAEILAPIVEQNASLVSAYEQTLNEKFDASWDESRDNVEENRIAFEEKRASNKALFDAFKEANTKKFENKLAKKLAFNDKRGDFWKKIQLAVESKITKPEQDDLTLAEDEILKVENLSMHFGGLKAVDELDFVVKKGEVFGLIGPNGAGKTTVFNCITQFYKPTKGTLYFKTKSGKVISLTDYKVHDIILKGIARTFQNVEVVKEVSVLDNLLIAATRQYHSSLFTQMLHLPFLKKEERIIRAKADAILRYMDLSTYRDRLAWGLPYGVLKRIEIARVLMCNPQLIILDEPAAGLNESETNELADLIRKIRTDFDCTVLLVEHDMGLVMKICDHICAISFGRKLAYGTAEEIQASKEVQEAYLGTDGGE